MNKEDIIMNSVFFGVVILSFALAFHMSKNNVAEEWNNHVDSVLRNKIKQEYHGKEGKSEYGEYTPSDEYKM